MRKPRKPQERTAVTRDLLLTAAEQVFARVGYEKAQVEEIALAAGFSKGALYAHFKSKEELFLALYETKTAASGDASPGPGQRSRSRRQNRGIPKLLHRLIEGEGLGSHNP